MASNVKIAVIGTGALGLVTVKNLVEEGFHVTAFERNSYVGGLWKYTTETKTSVLPTTVTNISKERGCYTDFPFPDDTPSLCPSAHVERYLERYADHFGLRPHIRLSTSVTQIRRDDADDQWIVDFLGPDGVSSSLSFDKVVIATGVNQKPTIPTIAGIDTFAGTVIHSQGFKRPRDFDGKTVFIVGIGSTAADAATELVGHARQIYISRRHGATIFSRTRHGRSVDHSLTYRVLQVQGFLGRFFPGLSERLLNLFAGKIESEAFPGIAKHPEWGLHPAPSLKQAVPTVSDELVPALETGKIIVVPGIQKIAGPRAVDLEAADFYTGPARLDDVDAIVFCTGYGADLGALLEPGLRPTRDTTPAWAAAPGSRGKPLPRLYRNVFSLDHPQSLAFMGAAAFPTPAFQLYDLASMALAQVWQGRSPLPAPAAMAADVDAHHAWIVGLAQRGPVYPGLVDQRAWLAWADAAAGTGLAEHLGWTSWRAWQFWLAHHAFYKLLVAGVYSPHLYRVFPGDKRKAWPGARAAIEAVNAQVGKKL